MKKKKKRKLELKLNEFLKSFTPEHSKSIGTDINQDISKMLYTRSYYLHLHSSNLFIFIKFSRFFLFFLGNRTHKFVINKLSM